MSGNGACAMHYPKVYVLPTTPTVCHPERYVRERVRESKAPENICGVHTATGSSTEDLFVFYSEQLNKFFGRLATEAHFTSPFFSQVCPARIHFFNESNILPICPCRCPVSH